MNILKLKNVKKYYGIGNNKVKALDGVSLEIKQGEFIGVTGHSGSGKTTLINLIAGIDVPTQGKVYIHGVNISILSSEELEIFRRRNIGLIFQDNNLLSMLDVYQNVVLPIQLDDRIINEKYVKNTMELLGIWTKRKCYPNQLSGGECQRIAIARAVIKKPAIILADEPTGSLDSKNCWVIVGLFRRLASECGQTIIMMSHNNSLIQATDRVITLCDGKII